MKSERTATKTRVARACADGKHEFFGHDLFDDLLPETTMAGLLFMSITGRTATAEQVRLLDKIAVVTSVADGRIWPLKLTRLGSAYGSVLAGFSVGQLAIEGNTIGMWPVGTAAAQLADVVRVGASKGALRAHVDAVPRWIGFGVPLRPNDERVIALRARLAGHASLAKKYYRAHERLAAALRAQRKLEPNIVSLVAALLMDLGCTPAQAGAMAFFLNVNVFVAHSFESASNPAEPLRNAEAVVYRGPALRVSPRALRARG